MVRAPFAGFNDRLGCSTLTMVLPTTREQAALTRRWILDEHANPCCAWYPDIAAAISMTHIPRPS